MWYGDAPSWVRVSCRCFFLFFLLLLFLLQSSRSRSQRGLMWSKYDSFYHIFLSVDSLATKLGLMIHHHKPECSVENFWFLHSRSRSERRFKMPMYVCPDDIFWTAEHFVTKLGMVMQHHKQECHLEENCLQSSRSRSQQGLKWSKY